MHIHSVFYNIGIISTDYKFVYAQFHYRFSGINSYNALNGLTLSLVSNFALYLKIGFFKVFHINQSKREMHLIDNHCQNKVKYVGGR